MAEIPLLLFMSNVIISQLDINYLIKTCRLSYLGHHRQAIKKMFCTFIGYMNTCLVIEKNLHYT